MSAKKIICTTLSAGTLLAVAVPAMADQNYRHQYRGSRIERPVVVERQVVRERTVVTRPVYQARPVYRGYEGRGYQGGQYAYHGRPVYSGPAYYPAPYYSERHDHTAVGAIGGGILGAVIGNHASYGDPGGTIVGAGVGAILGGIIGSNIH